MNLPFPPLACSVRACAEPLARDGARWLCTKGHSFDVARSGYLSLLQPQDRRSLEAGDPRETVDARRALLDGGFGDALTRALLELAHRWGVRRESVALELGCGEGHFLAALATEFEASALGIDLSPHAVERCARRHPQHFWLVANADRRLPLLAGSIDVALSIDGRRPRDELARVLAPGGRLLVAVPAPDDLAELRGEVLPQSSELDRVPRVLAELGERFELLGRSSARQRSLLDRTGLARLALATYRCARQRERERLERLDTLEVTSSHDLLAFAVR